MNDRPVTQPLSVPLPWTGEIRLRGLEPLNQVH